MQTKAGIIIAAILFVLVIIAGVVFRFGAPEETSPKLVGQVQNFVLSQDAPRAPDEAWHDAGGAAVSLGDFRGKVVLLNFWASWCAPCLRELPSINDLEAKLGGDKFEVVALNLDRKGEALARPVIDKLNLDRLKLNLDPESRVARELGVRVMPTTIIYDSAGRELGRFQGAADWNAPEAIALVSFFIDHPDFLDR